MKTTPILLRAAVVAAGAGVVIAAAAGPAAAHHCYKDTWQDTARANISSGTAWLPLSDLGAMVAVEEFGFDEECASHADEWVQAWMAETGVTEEPLIHSKATVGGGAAHNAGKEPKPFSYLSEDDFVFLTGLIFADCG